MTITAKDANLQATAETQIWFGLECMRELAKLSLSEFDKGGFVESFLTWTTTVCAWTETLHPCEG